jgi:hypothetical protein
MTMTVDEALAGARHWFERELEQTRRQLQARGVPEPVVDAVVRFVEEQQRRRFEAMRPLLERDLLVSGGEASMH